MHANTPFPCAHGRGIPFTTRPHAHRTQRKTGRAPPRTPEPVDGRKHIDIQTDAYLEELTDTVPEVDNNTQTDAFLDRPPTPLFVPQKSGLDATTQIENGTYCEAHGKQFA